jgi:signal transduction histidine kinase
VSTPGSEDTFARLVSLAVHDLRTPLATVSGFARTLQRTKLGDPVDKYVELMVSAGAQLADLLDEVGLAARIEGGRWEPNVQQVDSRELADTAAGRVGAAHVDGTGATVRVDRDAATLALFQLARCTLRHGGLERVELRVDGAVIAVGPVVEGARPILLGEDARDLGALIAARIVPALGGLIQLEEERLLVRLPS